MPLPKYQPDHGSRSAPPCPNEFVSPLQPRARGSHRPLLTTPKALRNLLVIVALLMRAIMSLSHILIVLLHVVTLLGWDL